VLGREGLGIGGEYAAAHQKGKKTGVRGQMETQKEKGSGELGKGGGWGKWLDSYFALIPVRVVNDLRPGKGGGNA